jgi:ketosteroid isomerase-like protein
MGLHIRALQPILTGDETMHDAVAEHASAADLQTLQALNDGYIRSVRTSDVAWFDENLAPDFMNSNPDGSLAERAGFLAQIARPCPVSDFEAEDVRIRLLGDLAIIHGRTVYRKPGGQPAAGRYTDVWCRRGERWLCVSADVTRG